MAKLTEDQVIRIISILTLELMSIERLAKAYDVTKDAIRQIENGTTWRYLHRPRIQVKTTPMRVAPIRKLAANGPRR